MRLGSLGMPPLPASTTLMPVKCIPAYVLLLGLAGVWLGGSAATAQPVTLRGFVTDASDGQPLQGVNVAVLPLQDPQQRIRGAVSDKDGFYQVNQIPPGRYALRISYVGYAVYTDTLALGAEAFLTLSVELASSEEALGEVIVQAESGATRVEAGLQTIRPKDLDRIPTPDASGDLASYLQSLPGVVSLGDRGGQLFIRGGTPSQNLVLFDGLPIYQPFHIIGFFSAFPQDLVSYVDVYAGGYGARYSGRISSVIDVSTREGNKQFFEGAASLSPFLTSLRVEGPLRRGRVSVLASLRRSVIERIAPTLVGEDLPFRFGDLFIKLQHTDQVNNRCSFSAMHTYDQGRLDPKEAVRTDVFRWNNLVIGGRCFVFPAESPILLDINTGVSYVKNTVGDVNDPERSSDALQAGTEINLTRFLGDTELHLGTFARMNWLGFRTGEQFQNVARDDAVLFGLGAYVDAEMVLGERWTVTPGVAFVVYPLKFPSSLEPRLRVVWRPGGAHSGREISAAAGIYRQTLVGVTDERDAGSAFIAWMPPPVGDAQARAIHALFGIQQQIAPGLRVAAEGYYKRLNSLPIPIWSTIARFTTTLTLAEGNAYGFDTRLEFQHQGFYTYVSYGYSWTEYFAQQANFGVWFGETVQQYHPPHDRRHQVNAVMNLDLGAFQASVRWQYGSGLPYTRPLGFDDLIPLRTLVDVREVYGTPRVLYEKPYQGRLPDYHRLDISLERAFPFRHGTLTAQVGAINVYDRANLFYFDLFTLRRVDQLPIIPTLSVKYETR